MQPGIQFNAMTRIALVIAVVFIVVLIIHLITGSRRLEGRPGRVSIICLALLLCGFGGLAALSQGSPDPGQVEGFVRFEAGDLASAAELMEDAAALEYSDGETGGRVGAAYFDLTFGGDGLFTGLAFTARYDALNPGEDGVYAPWQRTVNVNAEGAVYGTERFSGELETLPLDTLAGALRSLASIGWSGELGLSEIDDIILSSGRVEPQPGDWVLSGGELVPAVDFSGGPLFAIYVYSGSGMATILIDE